MDRLFGYLKGSEQYAAQIAEHEKKKLDLDLLIIEAQLKAWNLWDAGTQGLVDDARKLGRQAIEDALRQSEAERLRSFQETMVRRQEEAAAAILEAARKMQAAMDKLLETQRGLRLDSQFSYLNPREQVEEAKRRLEALSAQAQAGNVTAAEELSGAITDYLRTYASTYGRTGDFFAESRRLDELITLLTQRFGYTGSGMVVPGTTPPNQPAAPGAPTAAVPTVTTGGTDPATAAVLRMMAIDAATYYSRATASDARKEGLLTEVRDLSAALNSKISMFLARSEVA